MQKIKTLPFTKQDARRLLSVLLQRWAAEYPGKTFFEEKLYWAIYGLSQQDESPFRAWEWYEDGGGVFSRDLEDYLNFAGSWGRIQWIQKDSGKLYTLTGANFESKPPKNVAVDAVYATFKELLK